MSSVSTEQQILKLVSTFDGVSRKELAAYTGLSPATLTKVTKRLIDNGFIVEGERVQHGQGRKEVLLLSNPEKYRFLGIDIGGYYVRMALADNNLQILRQKLTLTADYHGGPLDRLGQEIEHALVDWGITTTQIDAVGVTVTGIVSVELNTILNIPNLQGWDMLPIVSVLAERFRWPVFLDEGGRAMAMAEKLFGKARQYRDFIVIQVGHGLVAGIVSNNQLIRGVNNVGGLLGHITADERAGRCLCGNYGCLENIITLPMLEKAFHERSGREGKQLQEAFALNDKVALDVVIDAGKALGVTLSNVMNMFNPEIIFLGGNVFDAFPQLVAETKRTILLRASRFATVSFQMESTSFGQEGGLMGSLTLAKSRLMFESW